MRKVRVGILDSCKSGIKDDYAQYLVSYLNSHLPSTLRHTSLSSHYTHLPSTLLSARLCLSHHIHLPSTLLHDVDVNHAIPIYILSCFMHVVVYLTTPMYHLHHFDILLILPISFFSSHLVAIVPNTHPANCCESYADRQINSSQSVKP